MEDLRIGVIGSGGRGAIAARAHRPGGGSRIVACCDIDEGALEAARKAYGNDVNTTTDFRELLVKDLDAVLVCTPDFLHEEHATAVLDAGKTLYLEKPMAITLEGCDRILKRSVDTKTRLYLGHNMRHMRFAVKMKELIDSGAIGAVKTIWCRHFVGHGGDFYFKDWHADRRLSTGLLLQKATHDLDLIQWLAGGYGRRVNALGALSLYGGITDRHAESERGDASVNLDNWPPLTQRSLNPVVDVEDLSMLNMELANGVLAAYQQCHFTPDYWRNYTVIGTEGRIENFGDGGEGTCIKLWDRRVRGYSGAADDTFPIHSRNEGHGGADERIVDEFVAFVRGEATATTSPVSARYSVAAGCAATESLRHGGVPVVIPDLDTGLFSGPGW